MMGETFVKLSNFEELLKLIEKRDGYYDWSQEYDKEDKKVKNTIEWLRRNAKSLEELNQYESVRSIKQ